MTIRRRTSENTTLHVDDVITAIGRPLHLYEEDWLDLLWVIHVADLVCHRGTNEEWNRSILLSIPVRDPSRVKQWLPLLCEIFGRMTHDALDIRLELEQNPPLSRYPQRAPQPVINAVALVSGGLDSLATAADVVANYEHACLLAYRL